MPNKSSPGSSRPSSRTRIPLSSKSPIYFIPERNPLLPPTHRASDLPMSSQSEFSPVKINAYFDTGGGMDSQGDEDEDDFDGIEDVSPSQIILPSARKSISAAATDNGRKESTLADLFSDDDDVGSTPLAAVAMRKEENQRSQNTTYLKPIGTRDPTPKAHILSSSPLFASSSSTSKNRSYQSDTPPSPFPETPGGDHDEEIVQWTPSPMSQRTKARRSNPVLGGNCSSQSDDIFDQMRKSGGNSASTRKPKTKAEVVRLDLEEGDEVEDTVRGGVDDFDDDGLFDGIDLDSLNPPTSTANSSTSNSKIVPKPSNSGPSKTVISDPGRAFRPSSALAPTFTKEVKQQEYSSSSTRQSSPPSDLLTMLDDQLRPDRLMLISDLTEAEQDFYKNHWRREGRAKRRNVADEWSDGEDLGPQPSKKKAARRPAKRGFRGKGRGRGRGRK